MNKKLNVFGSITTTEEHIELVKATLSEIASNSKKDQGNLEYNVCQSQEDPNTFFTMEKWESAESEAKHWEMEHLKQAFEKIGDKLAGQPIVYKGTPID